MSNYDRELLFGGQVRVGAEVINGTGDVQVDVAQGPGEDAESVMLSMTPEQALDFARLLADKAHEAMAVRWKRALAL